MSTIIRVGPGGMADLIQDSASVQRQSIASDAGDLTPQRRSISLVHRGSIASDAGERSSLRRNSLREQPPEGYRLTYSDHNGSVGEQQNGVSVIRVDPHLPPQVYCTDLSLDPHLIQNTPGAHVLGEIKEDPKEEDVSTDESHLTLSDKTMEEERIKRTLVTVNVPDYDMYQSEEQEIHSTVPPHTSHRYPVYIPQPDYDHSSNLSSELAMEQHQHLPSSTSESHHQKNKHRHSRTHGHKGKSKKNGKIKALDSGLALKSTGPEPDFPTLRSLTEDERYLIYGRFPVKKPKDYRWLSAFSFVINCIIGLIAVSYSIKSEDSFEAGRFTRAKQEGRKACACALLAIFVTLVGVTMILLYIFVL